MLNQHDSLLNANTNLCLQWSSTSIMLLDFSQEGQMLVSMMHSHRCMELLIVESGECDFYVRNEPPKVLKGGMIAFINQDIPHRLIVHHAVPLQTYLLLFVMEPHAATEKVPDAWIEDEQRIIEAVVKNDYMLTEDRYDCLPEMECLLHSVSTRHPGELVKIKNHLSNLIMSAFQSFAHLPVRADFDEIILNAPYFCASKITKFIREHFKEDISLASIAEHFHYSPRQCQRIIQDTLGISFFDYLTDLRLEYAKALLTSTNYSTEKIAECAGFKNGKSFARLFQAREQATPYRYRREQQEVSPDEKNT